MTLTPLALGWWNAWLLLVPMVAIGALLTARRRDVARRLSDMTGYTAGEKLCTVIASLLPYPFMGVALFTPLAPAGARLAIGAPLALAGSVAFASTLHVFAQGPADQPLRSGPYRLSRNPLYLSAALVFLGVCVATGSLLLVGVLAVLLAFQHLMILAEERACRKRFGAAYVAYAQGTSRYLGYPRS